MIDTYNALRAHATHELLDSLQVEIPGHAVHIDFVIVNDVVMLEELFLNGCWLGRDIDALVDHAHVV